MKTPRIGLLPLYIELYDQTLPEARAQFEKFYDTIAAELERRGLRVEKAPVCRRRAEFDAAVRAFERAQADGIVTLHLAYSPSLESEAALTATPLPLLVLDTTPAFAFGPGQDPGEVMYNHGIHGVQDMCNLLVRNGRKFDLEAGHWERSAVLDRAAEWAEAAALAAAMRRARVGLLGDPFEGMGDFALPLAAFRESIGLEVVRFDPSLSATLVPDAGSRAVTLDMEEDARAFEMDALDSAAHRRTAQAGIAVREWIARENLTAFTFNFLALDSRFGLPTVPFLEASKAMARGIGYAGEGDILTAALVGTLASRYPDTTFTEMFCPDWECNRLFLAHMGEMNPNLAAGRPRLILKSFPFTDVPDPVGPAGRFRPGEASLVNIAPLGPGAYRLIVAPVSMCDVQGEDRMSSWVHGWCAPALPLETFLKRYSELGGTHHLALTYGADPAAIARFGAVLGWESIILK